jgi:uncharacterized RDD family membrane protein YckC
MSWYYAENNERRGPIEDAAFQSLVAAGTIKSDTLVWREGFANWLPYSSAASTGSAASSSPVGIAGTASSSAVACSQCGHTFPADETITYEGRHVCVQCKPLFFQKVKEGATVVGEREYAGFGIRFGAKFLDNIIVGIASQVVGVFIGMAMPHSKVGPILAVLAGVAINATFITFFLGKYGATPGKMACKLEVIRVDGSPMTYRRAAGRYLGEVLSKLTLFIGYLMVAFDEKEKRALHDRICDTRVVRKPVR